MKTYFILAFILACCLLSACSNNDDSNSSTSPNLIVKFKFDPNQVRQDNLGQPSTIPNGNAAQSPDIARMSVNYIELAPNALTALGAGEVIFVGDETTAGGDKAIDFQKAHFAGNNETFITIPLSEININSYKWVRASLAYQEGSIDILVNGTDLKGTLGSFVGYNTYITNFDLNGYNFNVNDNKLQGFWTFEVLGQTFTGQAPEGATTVPNPIFDTSPVPQGSCVVTGAFQNDFTINRNETEDIVLTLSFSVNQSFEWTEVNTDGKYEPGAGEQVVDMGTRGLIPIISN